MALNTTFMTKSTVSSAASWITYIRTRLTIDSSDSTPTKIS